MANFLSDIVDNILKYVKLGKMRITVSGGIILDVICLHRNIVTRCPSGNISTSRNNGVGKCLGGNVGGIS